MAVMNNTVSQEEQYQIAPERSDMVRPPPRFTHDVKDSLVMKMNEAGGSGEASRIFKWFVTITTLQRTCQMMMMLMFTRYVTYYLIVQLLLMPVTSHIFFLLIANSQAYPLSLPTFALMFSRRTANLKVFHWSNIMSSYSQHTSTTPPRCLLLVRSLFYIDIKKFKFHQ